MILLSIASFMALVVILFTLAEQFVNFPRWFDDTLDTVGAWSWIIFFCGLATIVHQSL